MSLVERRYAEALITLAGEINAVDRIQKELQGIVAVYHSEEEFQLFLHNPKIDIETKKQAVKEIFSMWGRELVNFLMLLLDKGRIKLLPGIGEEFEKLANKKRSILSIKITSAVPLEEPQIIEIKEKYKQLYGSSAVQAQLEIDPSLVGGVRVQIGDKVTDGSIKGRLHELMAVLQK